MLGASDNEMHSYLEIAYAISQHGAQPNKDLAELWKRIVFNVLISNTDDHLRNHGFLYEHQKGWKLSPVYDINQTPAAIKPRILSMSIDFNNNEASLDLALSVIEDFRFTKKQFEKLSIADTAGKDPSENIMLTFGTFQTIIELVAELSASKAAAEAIAKYKK
jgi:serine/threonine protein kinase HipA of HipAB toxin-antitoxin module